MLNYQKLERENKALQEDNRLYRDSQSNYLILEEKYNTVNKKLHKAESYREKVEQLEYENEKLLEKISKWEAPDTEGNVQARSPENLTRIIGELQSTQLDLTGKHIQLRTKVFFKTFNRHLISDKQSLLDYPPPTLLSSNSSE